MLFDCTGPTNVINITRRSVLENTTPERQQYDRALTKKQQNQSPDQIPVFICYSGTNCSGDTVTAVSARECCVDTENGLSFFSSAGCSPCIGEY